MSLNKKFMIFIFIIIIIPMTFLFFVSDYVFKKHVESAVRSYLENAIKIARTHMISRIQETKNTCETVVHFSEIENYIVEEKKTELTKILNEFNKYNNLDYIYFVNNDEEVILSKPYVNQLNSVKLSSIIKRARQSHRSVVSEENLSLHELFPEDLKMYSKYSIKISNGKKNSDTYLTKCLTSICVTPIYKENNYVGALIVGDIINNDNYFPEAYSKDVENSFLSISIDGIRVTSNIKSPQKENFIGSNIPIAAHINKIKELKTPYFGKVNIDNEIHVFLDQPILNYSGETVGVLGVGIPENKFSIIMNTNRNLILIVTIICLLTMLIIGRNIANIAARPIIKATELAKQISQGNKDFTIDECYLRGDKSETAILLKTFQKMTEDLKKSEEDRKKYLDELQNEHLQQKKLSGQLKLLNQELETRVKARTQDLRQAIMILKREGEVKSHFLANMSHELRTPLNAIISSSEAINEGIFGPLNAKQKKHIQNTLKSSNHLLQLINDILDISKIEAGKMTLSLGYYSISSIVSESVSIVSSLAYRKNIEIQVSCIPSDFTFKIDAKKIKQILYNLLSNAVKFTPENGKITIEIYKDKEFIQLSVKDNGIGIKEEDQKKVFMEFEQVDTSYERAYEGTGLGLPLTKKLVELHGGSIYLISKLGEGTEVIISLPLM